MSNYPDGTRMDDIPGFRKQDERNERAYKAGLAEGRGRHSPAVFVDYDEQIMSKCLDDECELHGMQGYFNGFMDWRAEQDAKQLVSPDPVLYYICDRYKKSYDKERKRLQPAE